MKSADIILLEDADLYQSSRAAPRAPSQQPSYYQQQQQYGQHYEDQSQRPYQHRPYNHHQQRQYAQPTYVTPSSSSTLEDPTTPPYQVLLTGTQDTERSSKSPTLIDTIPAHYGALRPGGIIPIFARTSIGLALNWVIIGFFNGALPALVYPLFYTYLNFEDYRATAVLSLLDFAWNFKFVFGFITDCFPINRYRRKPYMFIGWLIFTGFMLAMAVMNKVDPYKQDGEIVNPDAASQGPRYVMPLMAASFAQLMVTVACEGMMLEWAHREGEYERGYTVCLMVIARFLGEMVGGLSVSFACNSAAYGGSFASAVPLDVIFAVFAGIASLGLFVTHFWLKEEQAPFSRQPVGSQFRQVWRFFEQRATWQSMIVLFVLSAALQLYVPEAAGINKAWLHAGALTLNMSSITRKTGYMIAAAILAKWGLHRDWRVTVILGLFLASVVALPVELLTVFDVVREVGVSLAKDQVTGVFTAIVWVMRLLVIAELVELGLESTTYGLLTTVCNLANSVVYSATNVAYAQYSNGADDLRADTNAVRWRIAIEYFVQHGARLVLAALVVQLLPRQKRHLRAIRVRGAPNIVIPVLLSIVMVLLFIAAITSTLLALFESTSCLPFAGGSGCHSGE